MARPGLSGRTALVTGAAQRVGRSIALALGRAGVNVIVHYRGAAQEASALRDQLAEMQVKAWTVEADFDKEEETRSLIPRCLALAGSLEILVNNASIFPVENLQELAWESLQRTMHVNAWAPFVLMRELAAAQGHGSIVNLLDTRVDSYDFTHTGYILSKHVFATLTRMCALEYAPRLRVNGIAPGLILPPAGKGMDYLERLSHSVPLARYGDPEDISQTVLFLLSNDFITGEIVRVDGGRHLRG
jgi:NAD(P)-dependent dehydrogenase (short-subunit alcohol dehydrogenase family)